MCTAFNFHYKCLQTVLNTSVCTENRVKMQCYYNPQMQRKRNFFKVSKSLEAHLKA